MRALAIDPKTPSTLHTGTHGGGVFCSASAAASRTRSHAGLGNLSVRALALDPRTPTTVYVGTLGGVFERVNGAAA